MSSGVVESNEEIIEKSNVDQNSSFDSLVIENARLYELAEERANKLEKALNEIKVLRGLVPICMDCKSIRDDKGFWGKIEKYISEHSEAEFSHSLCPQCMEKRYPGSEDELEVAG